MARIDRPIAIITPVTALLACASWIFAAEPAFRRHDLNPESIYSACAAVDVNRDGRLDVVCGGWWYEAPTWKQHFLRDVQMIRGRYDDYSNLPLDVDGDGWTDLVSANYRSRSLYWVRHPGKSLGPWERIVIDTPGPMETGRLVDIDGDGRLDVLPNGLHFAAWWEVVHKEGDTGKAQPLWIRHDLPQEVAGHGVGFGDVNGDGRGDIVGPRGWLEAPQNPRKGRWIWRREFELHRDCSIPILVHDVDGDGDNDVVWGRGHNTGLYWQEQTTDKEGERRWLRHAIDTSWSQPHSLLWADVDNDGKGELIAGKRYMGHDGKDLGEYDPLVIFWYKFGKAKRTWHRGVVSRGGRAGFGLDPKAVDLDADGDVDILAAGRSGLYWFENLLVHKDGTPLVHERDEPAEYQDHSKLLVYQDAHGERQTVKTPADWAIRRSHILGGMQTVMGELPDPSGRVPLDIRIVEELERPKYVLRKITYAAEPGDRVPAYLFVPNEMKGKAPAMLCLHQTTRIGKGEPAGLGGHLRLHYAQELAERGYVCIVPDYPSFGDYEYDFNKQGLHYASGSMKAIWNNIRAVDVLETLPHVDADRIGCIGHSLGGHNALFTAAFDLRLRAVVASCGFTAFHHYYGGKLEGWTSDRYMPRIREIYGSDPDLVPFDFYEVLAALSPRSVFVNAPVRDSNFDITGVKKVVAAAGEVYDLLKAKDRLLVLYPDSAHDFPDEVRRRA
ncbi:alpha/beta fold hydrolase, partial [Acidobacteria bacterium AH-259-A15]|nr:alpha/beta fold hydrolase [Acidobacteria bacterium AH-259-A15]